MFIFITHLKNIYTSRHNKYKHSFIMSSPTQKHILKLFNEACETWLSQGNINIDEAYNLFCKNFEIENDINQNDMNEKFQNKFTKIYNIYDAMEKNNLIGNENSEQIDNKIKINRIMGTLNYARNTIIAFTNVKNSLNKQIDFKHFKTF